MKRLSADDSADSRVKVGHRQAINSDKPPSSDGGFVLSGVEIMEVGDLVEIRPECAVLSVWRSRPASCCQALIVGLWPAAMI